VSAKSTLEKHTPERLDSSLKSVDVSSSVCSFALSCQCDSYDGWEPNPVCVLKGGKGCKIATKLAVELSKKGPSE